MRNDGRLKTKSKKSKGMREKVGRRMEIEKEKRRGINTKAARAQLAF